MYESRSVATMVPTIAIRTVVAVIAALVLLAQLPVARSLDTTSTTGLRIVTIPGGRVRVRRLRRAAPVP